MGPACGRDVPGADPVEVPLVDRPVPALGARVEDGSLPADGVVELHLRLVLPQPPEAVQQRGVGPAPDLGQLPEPALPDVPPDGGELLRNLVEVVLGDDLAALALVHPPELLDAHAAAGGAVAVQGLHVLEAVGPGDVHEAVVAGVEGVGRGVEKVAAHEGGEREEHGVAASEEVHRAAGVEAPLGGHDHVDQLGVAVLLHQRDDAPDGVDVHVHVGHGPGAVLPEVGVDGSLDDAVDHHLALHVAGLPRAFEGGLQGPLGLLVGPVGFREDVEDGPDVGAYGLLETDDLLVGDLDLAVHVALERPGVGHYDPGEVQELMEPLGLGLLPEGGRVAYDVGVGDERAEAEPVVELPRGDGADLGVDHGQECRGLDRLTRVRGEFAYPGESVPSDYLEHRRANVFFYL